MIDFGELFQTPGYDAINSGYWELWKRTDVVGVEGQNYGRGMWGF